MCVGEVDGLWFVAAESEHLVLWSYIAVIDVVGEPPLAKARLKRGHRVRKCELRDRWRSIEQKGHVQNETESRVLALDTARFARRAPRDPSWVVSRAAALHWAFNLMTPQRWKCRPER